MKAIKTLLCVVLSLVMALGMTGAYAEPLLDGGVTLRNVVIQIGEEEFALSQQARIMATADEDSAGLRFELINGENVLLPIAGEIDAEGVRFTLDDSGRVYTVDMDMLMQMLEIDQETLAEVQVVLETAAHIVETYMAAMAAVEDPANAEAYAEFTNRAFTAIAGEPVEAEMDINGTAYTGVTYKGAVTLEKMLACLDAYSTSGIAEWDALWKEFLNLFSMAFGTELTNYSDLKTIMMEQGEMTAEDVAMEIGEMEITIGGDEAVSCARITMDMSDEEAGMDAVISDEMIYTADGMDGTFTMTVGDGETDTVNVVGSYSADMVEDEITAVEGSLGFDYGYNYTYDDGYVDTMAAIVAIGFSGAKTEGLWDAALQIDYSDEYSWGYEGEVETYTDAASVAASCTETLEEDGSVTASIALTAAVPDSEYGLSFDLNCASASGLSALVTDNAAVYPVTDNEEDTAYTMLSADAMGLMADVMELSADETILSLAEKINSIAAVAYEDEYYVEEDYTGDDVAEEIAYTTVYSYEDAAAIYTGTMPSYTAPEGFELSYIDVSTTDLYAEYVNADYSYIALYLMDFGMDLGDVSDEVAYYDDGEGNIVGAEFVNGTTYVMFYFDSVTQAEADSIMAGFSM